jgi:glycosyltransferase involved in cell wall biosynthesis
VGDRDLIVWLPAINPYWAKRFAALHASGRVRFQCWFNAPRGEGREWLVPDEDMAYPHVFLPPGPRRYLTVARLWARARPRCMFSFHYEPALWPALAIKLVPHGELAYYVEKTFDAWTPRTSVKERLKQVLFRVADVVFSPGQDGARYVARYRPPGKRFGYLPHVLDLEAFRPARAARRPQPDLRLLYLGRFVPEKGLRDLLQAVDALDDDTPVSLQFVGSGSMREEIEAWAAKARIPVKIDAFVQQADLLPFLVNADVLVFPTHGDPYGLVASEAMAAGMTVISSTEAGEITERLTDGEEPARGIVVPQEDPAAIAEAIRKLSVDRETLSSMQQAAAAYADREFPISRWVEAVEAWCADGTVDVRAAS